MPPTALPSIVTLTLNPSVDVTYGVARLLDDQKVHASAYRYDPGGNGINVARALGRLGASAHAVFTAAGEIGALLERLIARDVAHPHPCRIAGETRINVTVEQAEPPAQYEVIGIGPTLDPGALHCMERRVVALACGGFVALTGSTPPGTPADTYPRLMAELRHQGARVVADMQGEALRAAAAGGPFLLKPNRVEFEQLVGRELAGVDAIVTAARDLVGRGVGNICVSLGGDGAVLVNPQGAWLGRAPSVVVGSTVGAGDSMVAGLIAAFARGDAPEAALRLGLACGSGTAEQPGTELFDPARLPDLLDRAHVERLPDAGR